jgi:2,4-diaminopentanoate dehydrogenase
VPDRTPGRPLRVVQWATGNIGTRSLRAVIEHPGLDLAGLYVYTDEKVGRDAGHLCGLESVGVTATRDMDEIVGLEPDCVLYMPRFCDFGQVCRLLSSGANIVTTRGEFHRVESMDAITRVQVEEACSEGAASVHSTGSSPGFITEAVPILLTSIQRRLNGLMIDEFADLSQRDSPELLFDLMGFGQVPGDSDEDRLAYLRASFGPSLELVAEALCIPLDSVEATGEVATALRKTTMAAGDLEAGTVAGQRTTVSAMRSGNPVLRFRATWYCTKDLDPQWDLGPTGWHVSVDGDAPLEVDINFAVPLERMAALSPGYTANRAVNSVPFVCAAPPGITTSIDLPQIVSVLG